MSLSGPVVKCDIIVCSKHAVVTVIRAPHDSYVGKNLCAEHSKEPEWQLSCVSLAPIGSVK